MLTKRMTTKTTDTGAATPSPVTTATATNESGALPIPPPRSARSRRLAAAARIVLGIVFGLSGVNHVLALVPMPAMTGRTALFWDGLAQTGYFFPLLGLIELGAGALLATGWMVPLALSMVAPIVVNVVLFHALLAPEGLGIAALVVVLGIAVARSEWAAFRGVLTARAPAGSAAARAVEVVLGLAFVASGLFGATGHTPPPSSEGAAAMMKGLAASGFFLPLLCGVQIGTGALLVARRYVGIALIALAPVVVEIAAYRLYVATAKPGMLLMAAALAAGIIGLGAAHRRLFAPWAATGVGDDDDRDEGGRGRRRGWEPGVSGGGGGA